MNSSASAPEQVLDERIRLQDRIIELLNEQLRECRERLDGQSRDLTEAYQRLQLTTDLSTQAYQRLQLATDLSAQRESELERVQREIEALRCSWSWRLTKPLRLLAFGGISPRR